jgi:hypothetical protein
VGANAWQAIFEGATFLIAVGNGVMAAFFWKLRATYVSQDNLVKIEGQLNAKLAEIADKLDRKADEQDLKGFDGRLRVVEQTVASQVSEIRGVRDIMIRIEHQVGLLVEYRMQESRP